MRLFFFQFLGNAAGGRGRGHTLPYNASDNNMSLKTLVHRCTPLITNSTYDSKTRSDFGVTYSYSVTVTKGGKAAKGGGG